MAIPVTYSPSYPHWIALITAPMHLGLYCHLHKGVLFNCKFFETHQMITITCSPHVTWFVSKNLQLIGAPWRWCQWRLKEVRAIINIWSSMHSTGCECWSVKGDMNTIHSIYNKIGWHLFVKMMLVPCINTVYGWIRLKIFLLINNEVCLYNHM